MAIPHGAGHCERILYGYALCDYGALGISTLSHGAECPCSAAVNRALHRLTQ